MNPQILRSSLATAVEAAQAAGALLRRELRRPKRVNLATQHDIKLELDVRCQRLIERRLKRALPEAAVLGEEGVLGGNPGTDLRWVVDPIDGTVNFAYGIPHACVAIALQQQVEAPRSADPTGPVYEDGFRTRVGVVYDPFTDDLWTATHPGPARHNGRVLRVQPRERLDESIVALGFAKSGSSLNHMLGLFEPLTHRVRKLRIMGSAALSMTYVATGRFDAYLESGVRLWDIAAAGLVIQAAGGIFWRRALPAGDLAFEIVTSAAPLQKALHRLIRQKSK